MLRKTLIALALLFGTAPGLMAATLDVEQAWIREAPPGMSMLAGFMTLHNPGREERVLVGVDSPDFRSVEMHETRIDERGVARMLPVERLPIPAGGTVRFAPGGLHLMLIDPERELRHGDEVTVRLHLDNGICITVPFEVRRTAPGETVR